MINRMNEIASIVGKSYRGVDGYIITIIVRVPNFSTSPPFKVLSRIVHEAP